MENVCKWRNVQFDKKVIVVIMIISMYMTKPMIFGANLTPIAMVLMFSTAMLLILDRKIDLKINRREFLVIVSVVIFFMYLLSQSIFMLGYFTMGIIKALISIGCLVFSYSVLLKDKTIRFYFFKGYIITLAFFVISYLITFTMSLFIDCEGLKIYRGVINGYGYIYDIYFPFTPATGITYVGNMKHVRLTAFYRECGIAQMVYLWAFIVCQRYFKNHKYIKILMITGTIMCFSTVGYINLIIMYLLYIVLNFRNMKRHKMIISLIILLIFIYGFNNIEGIRLEDKNSISYDARITKMWEAFDEFIENPILGTGYSNAYIEGTSTSFIQSSYTIGIVGVMLYLNVYIIGYFYTFNKKEYITAILPILITTLFSQPIFDAPILFIFLIHNYDSKYKII